MSAREEVEKLLIEAQKGNAHPERIRALQDAMEAVAVWQHDHRVRTITETTRKNSNRRRSQKNNAVNREFIPRSPYRRQWYTDSEWEIIATSELTVKEIAAQLGRTPKGIQHARKKLRERKIIS